MDAPTLLSAGNDDIIDREGLLRLGWTDREIAWAVRTGWLQRVQPGVYLHGAAPPTWLQQLRAALAACGPAALVSHRAALMLWGLDGLAGAPVEITVPYNGRPIPSGTIAHRSRRIEPASVVNGIPVTSVERTLLEVGAKCPPVVVEKAFSSAWRKGLTTPDKTRLYLEDHGGKGRRGVTCLRAVVDLYSDGGRPPGSAGEVAFLRMLRAHGIEEPERQFLIPFGDGSAASVDFAWPLRRKAIEFVGLEVHADSRAHDNDTWRENRIREAGWDLRRYAPHSLRVCPDEVARQVIRFL